MLMLMLMLMLMQIAGANANAVAITNVSGLRTEPALQRLWAFGRIGQVDTSWAIVCWIITR